MQRAGETKADMSACTYVSAAGNTGMYTFGNKNTNDY